MLNLKLIRERSLSQRRKENATGRRKPSHIFIIMNCPHCKKEIPESLLKKWWASLGGKKSKRKIGPEAQAKMQSGRVRVNAANRNLARD
jgi:hypothetical protein